MIGKLEAIFATSAVVACSMITTDAFVYKTTHSASKSPLARRQTQWDLSKGESGDPTKSDDVAKAQQSGRIGLGSTHALEPKIRIPRVPSALDLAGSARRVGFVLHLSREEREEVGAEQEGQAADRSTQQGSTHPCPLENDLVALSVQPAGQLTAMGSLDDLPATAETVTDIAAEDALPSAPTTSTSKDSNYQGTVTPIGDDEIAQGTHQASSMTGMVRYPGSSRGRDASTGFFFVPRKKTSPDLYSLDHQAFDGAGFNRGPSLTLPYFPAEVPAPAVHAEVPKDDVEGKEPSPLPLGSTPLHPTAESVQMTEPSVGDDYVADVLRDALSGRGAPRTTCIDQDETSDLTVETVQGSCEDMASLNTSEEACLVDADIAQAYHDALSGREPRPAADDGHREIDMAGAGVVVPEGSGDTASWIRPEEGNLIEAYVAQAFCDAFSGRGLRRADHIGKDEIGTAGAGMVPEGSGHMTSRIPSEEDSLVRACVAQAIRDALSGHEPRRTALVGRDDMQTARKGIIQEGCGDMASSTDSQGNKQTSEKEASSQGPPRTAGTRERLRRWSARIKDRWTKRRPPES